MNPAARERRRDHDARKPPEPLRPGAFFVPGDGGSRRRTASPSAGMRCSPRGLRRPHQGGAGGGAAFCRRGQGMVPEAEERMFGNMRVNGNEEKQKMFPLFFKSVPIFRRLFFLKKAGIFCMFHILIILIVK